MTKDTYATEARRRVQEIEYASLAAEHVPPCISVYMNILATETGQQRWLRLRNMLREVAPELRAFSLSEDEAESWLKFAWRAIKESQKPKPNAKSVAIFVARDFLTWSPLRESVRDRVVVGNEFFVRPLLPVVPRDEHFFVLALSQNQVKLYEGSSSGLRERNLRGIPQNIRKDFESHALERDYQMHTASSRASGQKGAVFHGPSLDEKDKIAHFLRDVERGVAGALKGQQAPLILAGVEYLIPIYRGVNTYAHLAEDTIVGSPSQMSLDQVYKAAWKIVENSIAQREESAFAVYQEHANTALTSDNLRETLAAAQRGLVRFLFVSAATERWGSVASPEIVHVHSKQESGDADLVNLAALLTLRHGGQVFVALPNQLQQGTDMAAVYRFAPELQSVGAA